ncbi:unnamed protein product [Anisakis simplex]|uniref:FABP domain-containing protein n=1 Tax=Anisakis simplex TaxID=6269 RepID=A0A0M3JW11_ANISI|nr:unnamed protein product [Anisakis simplex]
MLCKSLFVLCILSLSLIGNPVMASVQARIPDKFMGSFKLDRSENFDEFLASKGVNWFIRKMIQFASLTKTFSVSKTDPDNAYDAANLSSKKNTHFNNWKLNETFTAEGMDDKMHRITFNFDDKNDTLTETHIRTDDPNDKGETYYYTISGDELVMKIANDQVTCHRYFKKQSSS